MVDYQNEMRIAVSSVCDLNFYNTEDLETFMDEPYIDSLDRMIKEIYLSPCGRILIVCEEFRLSVWDLKHQCRVYKEKCLNSKIQHFTNEMLVIFCEIDHQKCGVVICFTFNGHWGKNDAPDKIKNYPGRPLKSYPLSFYRNNDKNSEYSINTDPCIHEKIYHCTCRSCMIQELTTEEEFLSRMNVPDQPPHKHCDQKGLKRCQDKLKALTSMEDPDEPLINNYSSVNFYN